MSKFLFVSATLFVSLFTLVSSNTFASQITMYENKAPLNTQQVERVIVRGEYVQMNTVIHPCAAYPGYPEKILGDVYSCNTNRAVLTQILGDEKMTNLSDKDLTQYLLRMDKTFHCDTAARPSLVSYKGENVYWFSGPLIPGAPAFH